MQTDYSSPDIDVTAAQRQAAETQASFVQFTSIRSVSGSADATFSFGMRTSRPAAGVLGDRYFANDIGSRGGWLYYWTGTVWAIVVGWASGTNAARAALTVSAVDNGAWFYTTDTSKFWEVSGGAWADRTPASGVGTVTSFSAAPTSIFDVATATTTPALSLDNQAANIVLAGPTGGGAAVPAFRALVAADMPAGLGTVTSFSAAPTGIFDVANPTTTPALSLDNQSANTGLFGPTSGGAATPAFRLLVNADLPAQTWSSWTPTWTNLSVGNGTVAARYTQIGKLVTCRLTLVFGSTTSITGVVSFSLPVTSVTYAGTALTQPLGTVILYDLGTALFAGRIRWASTTTAQPLVENTTGTYSVLTTLSSTVPFTWAAGDELQAEFTFEAA